MKTQFKKTITTITIVGLFTITALCAYRFGQIKKYEQRQAQAEQQLEEIYEARK